MLRPSIDAYLALRRAVGSRLKAEESLLHDFARWAVDRGDTHVRTQTATEWGRRRGRSGNGSDGSGRSYSSRRLP